MQPDSNDSNHLATPFANIALTFSGGGFRAAAYSLGALSYLQEIKWPVDETTPDKQSLLNNVSYISSTSGGSFTNALYSAYIHNGKTFEDVYAKLMKDMTGQNLLEEVFTVLGDHTEWDGPGKNKQKNFINAFAKVYDKIIFEKEVFGVFWNKDHVKKFEVCFNCTEFYRGLSFRFQTEGYNNPQQVMGNKYLHFDTKQIETIRKIKLADMVAASSCFPAGFEPILYPQDFSYAEDGQKLGIEDLKKAMLFENYHEETRPISNSYGFMDGGITDNQGLYSVMLADKKRRNRVEEHPFDLIIVTDVTSYFMDEYKAPLEKTKPTWRRYSVNYFLEKIKNGLGKAVKTLGWSFIISLLAFVAGLATIIFSINEYTKIIAGFVCGFSLVLLLLIFFVRRAAPVKWLLSNKEKIAQDVFFTDLLRGQSFISEKITVRLINFLKTSKISLLEQIITARISSMLSLLLDINLKQTRRLIYEMFYDDTIWDNRRLPNFIYELSSYNTTSRKNRFNSEYRLKWKASESDKEIFLSNCGKLNEVAEEARTMGTTLWFDDKDVDNERQKKIVATGQFTTCCNLLEYVISLERKGIQFEEKISQQLESLKKRLTEDFIRFKSEPFYLFNALDRL